MAYPFKTSNHLVDIHVHGASTYDTQTRRKDDILHIAHILGDRGTAGFLPTVYPGSLDTMRENMGAIRRAMETQQNGAKILGMYLEGPFLNPERAGSLDATHFQEPSAELLNKLVDGFEDIIKIITLAPELPGGMALIDACRKKGFRVHLGHSDATFEQAEEAKRAGATGITHVFNAMRGFHHREPGLSGFGLMDEDIYVEVIADMAHVHPQSLKMLFDMKSADKILLISDSIKGKNWGNGPIRDSEGMLLGSGIPLADAVKNLIQHGVPQDRAIQFSSKNPMKYLGINPRDLDLRV